MNAKQAVDWVDPVKWRNTSAEKKLEFLKEIQQRIKNVSRNDPPTDYGGPATTRPNPIRLTAMDRDA